MNEGYHFFWKGVLSQLHPTAFTSGGRRFNCCEQYMMVRKAQLFKDLTTMGWIMHSTNPARQKALGRCVKGFDQTTWDVHKHDIVLKGNRLRAQQDEAFRNALLDTGDKVIVEASPWDRIWGIGFSESNALANKERWGQNLLGLALTEVREELNV